MSKQYTANKRNLHSFFRFHLPCETRCIRRPSRNPSYVWHATKKCLKFQPCLLKVSDLAEKWKRSFARLDRGEYFHIVAKLFGGQFHVVMGVVVRLALRSIYILDRFHNISVTPHSVSLLLRPSLPLSSSASPLPWSEHGVNWEMRLSKQSRRTKGNRTNLSSHAFFNPVPMEVKHH